MTSVICPQKVSPVTLTVFAPEVWNNMLISDLIKMFDCRVNLYRRNLKYLFENNIYKMLCSSNLIIRLFPNLFIFTLLVTRNSPGPQQQQSQVPSPVLGACALQQQQRPCHRLLVGGGQCSCARWQGRTTSAWVESA